MRCIQRIIWWHGASADTAPSMLIAEQFFLIACNPRRGVPEWPRAQDSGQLAAAALLLELAMQSHLRLEDGCLVPETDLPLSHPLLTHASRLLQVQNLTASAALRSVAQRLDPLDQQILDGLFRRDLVHRIQTRRWWLLGTYVRYPLRSMQARNEAIGRLRAAANHGFDDLSGLSLLLLVNQSGLLPRHLDAREHERATRHLLALNVVDAQQPEALRLYAEIRTALLN